MASISLNSTTGEYDFEAEEMVGSFVGSGFHHGVRVLKDKRTMTGIPRPDLFLLNFYRVFITGEQLGYLRELNHVAKLDGEQLEILMESSDWHQAELRVIYQVVEPSTIDLKVHLKSHASYSYYQIYLSSYFSRGYNPYIYLNRGVKYKDGREPGFVHLEENDFVRGY